MSENLKNFLMKVSEDPELMEKVKQETEKSVLISIAKELGLELTEADFETAAEELSDDDLDVVTGGSDVSCACPVGGGGTEDSNDKVCACVLAGVGYDKGGSERCLCGFAGYGYDT